MYLMYSCGGGERERNGADTAAVADLGLDIFAYALLQRRRAGKDLDRLLDCREEAHLGRR
jgi:hypothetical protein